MRKSFIVNNNNKMIRAWCLREAPEEHTYLPKKTVPVKLLEIKMLVYYKSNTREGIFEEKGIREQFCSNKESSNDPSELNTINQSNNKSC